AYTVCALRKQNNQEEAIRRYAAFAKDYRRVMNEEYGIAFADIKV
ncbi:putative transmembrane domain protein, partial [Bacteroides fragilis str. 3986 N(B)19]